MTERETVRDRERKRGRDRKSESRSKLELRKDTANKIRIWSPNLIILLLKNRCVFKIKSFFL
jgi:hypothetical protein